MIEQPRPRVLANMGTDITEVSTDGRTVRVEFGVYTLSPEEAHEFANLLSRAASYAENADSRHERHVNLQASCALCRYEAGPQIDRLEQDEESDE